MDYLTLTYLVVMALGLLWVVYRIIHYVHSQGEREFGSMGTMSEEEFKAYIDALRQKSHTHDEASRSGLK